MAKAQKDYDKENQGEEVMATRLLKSTFGSTRWDGGAVPVGLPIAPGIPSLQFIDTSNDGAIQAPGWMECRAHNDIFALDNTGATAIPNALHYATHDYIDLRDLLENQQCLDDIVVNIQRQQELPYAAVCYNLPPVNAIYETLIISQQIIPVDAILGSNEVPQFYQLHSIGFTPTGILDTATGAYEYVDTRMGALVYVETRKYVQDGGQQWYSPDTMGQMNGIAPGDPALSETRWLSDFAMAQRTVRGNPDLIVGPGLHVVRVFSMWAGDRSAQAVVLDPATNAVATEFQFNTMRLWTEMPAIQVNIMGNQRDMTATEQAVWYSNILLS